MIAAIYCRKSTEQNDAGAADRERLHRGRLERA
jgi:hypothetical protein